MDKMNNKALVVIDIQNDITKHYRDIIGNINAAIEWLWLSACTLSISSIITPQLARGRSSLVAKARNWCQK